MTNIISDVFRELERRRDARRLAREMEKPVVFTGGKGRPRTPIWPKPKPYQPVSDYRLRSSHL
jgi:hypothetical protein